MNDNRMTYVFEFLILKICSVSNLNFLSSFLWSNAGFNSLRKLSNLREYDVRYDPAVIPIKNKSTENTMDVSNAPYTPSPPHPARHYSIADYHSAFEMGKLTPLAVAEAILDLAASPEHKVAFLSVKSEQVLSAAKASTQRYKDGKALGMLDGVPVAVKGMLAVSYESLVYAMLVIVTMKLFVSEPQHL